MTAYSNRNSCLLWDTKASLELKLVLIQWASGYFFRSIAGGFLVSSKCCFFFLYCFVLFALYLTEVVKSRVRQLSSLGIVVDGTKAKPQQGNQTEGGKISPARYSITNQRDNHWQIHSTYNSVGKANTRLNRIRRILKLAWCWDPYITWCWLLIEILYKKMTYWNSVVQDVSIESWIEGLHLIKLWFVFLPERSISLWDCCGSIPIFFHIPQHTKL